ncbi:MAG: hypothetical protein WKF47_13005 [Geodermatophilaceae bacterium]
MAEVDKSEKITINVGLVDLGQIDLLVDEGFYANRTDFIRTAIRRQLETRSGVVDQTVARRTLTLGTQHYGRRELEELRATGGMVELRVLGLATLADDVSPRWRWQRSRPWRSSGPSGRRGRSRQPWHQERCDQKGRAAARLDTGRRRGSQQQRGGPEHD